MSEYQQYYKPLLDEIIQTVCEDWDFAIGEYGVGIKSCDCRFSYIKNNLIKHSRGEPPFENPSSSLRALIALRDHIYHESGRRLWGLTMRVDREHQFEVELSFDKAADDFYDDTKEWNLYLQGAKSW